MIYFKVEREGGPFIQISVSELYIIQTQWAEKNNWRIPIAGMALEWDYNSNRPIGGIVFDYIIHDNKTNTPWRKIP